MWKSFNIHYLCTGMNQMNQPYFISKISTTAGLVYFLQIFFLRKQKSRFNIPNMVLSQISKGGKMES